MAYSRVTLRQSTLKGGGVNAEWAIFVVNFVEIVVVNLDQFSRAEKVMATAWPRAMGVPETDGKWMSTFARTARRAAA